MLLWETDTLDLRTVFINTCVLCAYCYCFWVLKKKVCLSFEADRGIDVVGICEGYKLAFGPLESPVVADTHAIMLLIVVDLTAFYNFLVFLKYFV